MQFKKLQYLVTPCLLLTSAWALANPKVDIVFNDPKHLCSYQNQDHLNINYAYLATKFDQKRPFMGTTPSLASGESFTVAPLATGFFYSDFFVNGLQRNCGLLTFVPGSDGTCAKNLAPQFWSDNVQIVTTPREISISGEPTGYTLDCQVVNSN